MIGGLGCRRRSMMLVRLADGRRDRVVEKMFPWPVEGPRPDGRASQGRGCARPAIEGTDSQSRVIHGEALDDRVTAYLLHNGSAT